MSLSDYQIKRKRELQKTVVKSGLDKYLDEELEAMLIKGLNNELCMSDTVALVIMIAEKFEGLDNNDV